MTRPPTDFASYVKLCKNSDLRLYVELAPKLELYHAEGNLHIRVHPSLQNLVASQSFYEVLELYLTARVFSEGPKLFRPTAEQLRLLGEMTLNVPLAEFAMPFPTVVVEFPTEYSATHITRNPEDNREVFPGAETQRPVFSVLHRSGDNFVHSLYTDAMVSLKSWYHLYSGAAEVEDWLTAEYGVDFATEEVTLELEARRAVLAYVLLLDEVGVKKRGPLHPGQCAAWRKTADKNNEHSAAARENLRRAPQVYELNQEVELYRTVDSHDQLGEPTGRTVAPHHRRGHYRNVPCGPGRSERRRVRVPPVFVNKHLFLGSMADAKAVYKSKSGL